MGAVALAGCVPERGSLALLPERLLADGSAFTLCTNITEHTRVRKFCDLLCWSDIGTVMLCSISFSRRWESPISCRGDGEAWARRHLIVPRVRGSI